MGLLNSFFKKPKPILNEENLNELKEIQRKVYFEEAKIRVEKQAREKAQQDFIIPSEIKKIKESNF